MCAYTFPPHKTLLVKSLSNIGVSKVFAFIVCALFPVAA